MYPGPATNLDVMSYADQLEVSGGGRDIFFNGVVPGKPSPVLLEATLVKFTGTHTYTQTHTHGMKVGH